jgi:hypothetical protein
MPVDMAFRPPPSTPIYLIRKEVVANRGTEEEGWSAAASPLKGPPLVQAKLLYVKSILSTTVLNRWCMRDGQVFRVLALNCFSSTRRRRNTEHACQYKSLQLISRERDKKNKT